MKSDQALQQAHDRLKAEVAELARANEALKRELAEQQFALSTLKDNALRSLAAISGDWYWEQDANYRFIDFAAVQGSSIFNDELIDDIVGKCRWDLPGITPLSSTWQEHRAVLDARQPFRGFEYMRTSADGTRTYFLVSGVPLFDSEGRFCGYRGTARDVTATRRADEAQREAFAFLNEIVDNVPIALHLKSAEGRLPIQVWNKAAQALYGVPREEAIGRTVHELWPAEEAERMRAADLALIRSGDAEDFPDRPAVTRNRGAIHVHMRKVALKDASGRVTHLLVTAEDISERRAAEARLRQSEMQFRSLTELSSDWYWETDEQFRLTVLSGGETDENRRWIAGFLGKARWEIDTSPANQQLWADHRAVLERRETFRDFEYERLDRDGRVSVLCISGEPFSDVDGRFAGYRGVGSDITARKLTETALRDSEARFRAVVAALAEGVVLRDAEGHIIDCNASAERILGLTLAEIKGRTVLAPEWQTLREDGSLMPSDEIPSVAALRTGQPQNDMVICYRKPDGQVLWVQINVQPLIEGGRSQPSGFVTTITDISQRKRDEIEIVRLNVDLENRVLRRTAQLEAANKELEAFSYSVAHDLRSPLSGIDGFSALLQKALREGINDKADHYLARIRSGVQRMGVLTDGLLSLAQLSRTSLHWDDMDISAEATLLLRQHAERDSARLVRTWVEPGMTVRADVALLRQVLQNLISNAWKFTSKTSDAEITVGRETGPDQQPVYFVRDNGAGFDMAYADKLFGTFQRLHSPDEFSGSGIGLATVKRIVLRHGGRIWAQAAVGEGSTFYFTLVGDEGGAVPRMTAPDGDSSMALALPRSRHLSDGAAMSSDNDALSANDQFSNAFEHAAIGMALIAVDSRRLRVNSAFCQMLGYSEAEMLARTVQDITHPDDIEWDVLQRKRALAGEIETYNWEKRYRHKTGRIVWGHLTCSLVRDADRKPLHFISQVQDITERKESERTLRESEERFRALTELASDWFWEQDADFRFVGISAQGLRTHSAAFKGDQSIGKTRWELPYANMDESVWAAHRAQLERHEVFRDFEVTRLDDLGQVRHVSISGVPVFDASGNFTGYRGTGRDTTEMHRVSSALRASEQQLREITDTVPALIAYVDKTQRFRFHNRAYEEVFGLSREQINGKTLLEVMGAEFYESLRGRVEEVLSGYPVVYERTQLTAHGDYRDFVVNYFPRYSDEDGQVIGFYSLASDVTELKRIDRMKSEFVSTVSHELRTPLTSIRGSLGLISGGVAGVLPDAAKNLIAIASNNCERLIRLINDILDIEKIESGKIGLNVQATDLGPLLAQVLAANSHYGSTHQIPLKLEMPDGTLMVKADNDRLVQVITNLLSNAMKFSPPDTPVEVRLLRATGSRVRVEVRDHGPGIPEDFRKRIFQKFSQADSSDTRAKGGTGLGLNISRAIIERLGGSIGFDTEAGVGTTFFFELPEWKEPVAAAPATGDLPAQTADAGRPRVLVCEDDPDIARLIVMMLDRGGFDADEAYSAAQAQARLALRPYAAMTVDLKLPDADGLTLIRTLRSEEATRDLPIVVVSASASEGELQFNNQLLSVSDWLEKPIDQNLLIVGLRRAIAGAGSRPRILHVEDDLDIQRITAAIAQDFATFEFAATLAEARTRLRQQHFDLVLLDLALGDSSGWDLLADIEAMTLPPPVVVFSAQDVDRQQHAQVAAVLLKAQTSNEELLQTLQRVLSEAGSSGK